MGRGKTRVGWELWSKPLSGEETTWGEQYCLYGENYPWLGTATKSIFALETTKISQKFQRCQSWPWCSLANKIGKTAQYIDWQDLVNIKYPFSEQPLSDVPVHPTGPKNRRLWQTSSSVTTNWRRWWETALTWSCGLRTMWFWWINSFPLWPPSWLTTQQDWPGVPGWISSCIWSRDCGVRQWLSSSILSWFTFNVMAGYAWDLQPLLELISTTALITLILHSTFNWMFTGVRQRSWLLRLILLFLLVLLMLQSISRYHLSPLCWPSWIYYIIAGSTSFSGGESSLNFTAGNRLQVWIPKPLCTTGQT